jgi:hypothetical protein
VRIYLGPIIQLKNGTKHFQHAFRLHPTINELADKIRREQSKVEVDIALLRGGQEPKPRKAIYRKLDEKIQRLVAEYPNVELGEYLCNISVNM